MMMDSPGFSTDIWAAFSRAVRTWNATGIFRSWRRWRDFSPYIVDQKISGVGRDRIAEAIFDSILEIRDDDVLHEYLRKDFVDRLRSEESNILDDLRLEVDRFTPANDSLGALWNRLVLANRGVHAIAQQMAIMRSFLDVYCPFSGDVEYHRMQWKIPPERSAYKRIYIDMYRRRFPDFGKIPYGASLLPLTRSPLSHNGRPSSCRREYQSPS